MVPFAVTVLSGGKAVQASIFLATSPASVTGILYLLAARPGDRAAPRQRRSGAHSAGVRVGTALLRGVECERHLAARSSRATPDPDSEVARRCPYSVASS